MAYNFIIFLLLAVLQLQIISTQYIANAMGPALLANPATFNAPISFGNQVPFLAGPALSATVAAPVSSLPAPNTVAAPVSASFAAPSTLAVSNAMPASFAAANIPSRALSSSAISGISVKPTVLSVTSVSPIAPNGVSVNAENIYLEGPLAVSGQLPYLGTVSLEGALASSGSGVAKCGCGNGEVGIVSEGFGGAVSGGLIY